MTKLISLVFGALIFLNISAVAQNKGGFRSYLDTSSTEERDTLINQFMEILADVERILASNSKNHSNYYYDILDITTYYDGFSNKNQSIFISFANSKRTLKGDFYTASYDALKQLVSNLSNIREYLRKSLLTRTDMQAVNLLVDANRALYHDVIFVNPPLENIISPNCPTFRITLTIVNKESRLVDNAICHVLSKLECRNIECANCLIKPKYSCTEELLNRIKTSSTFDPNNPIPIILSPGPYVIVVVVSGKIIFSDIITFANLPCTEIINWKIKIPR